MYKEFWLYRVRWSHIFCIMKLCSMKVGIFYPEFMVFFHVLFPTNRTLWSIQWCDHPVFRIHFFNFNICLLLTHGRNRQMSTDEHSFFKNFIFHFYRRTDTNAAGHMTIFLHLLHTSVQQTYHVFVHITFYTRKGNACTGCKWQICFYHRLEKSVKNTHFSIRINPADSPVIYSFIKFCLFKIRNVFTDDCNCFFLCVRIVRFHSGNNFSLYDQAAS